MRQAVIEAAAEALRTAETSRSPCSPIRNILGEHGDLDSAYAVQDLNNELHRRAGRRQSGSKIGLTSKAIQQQVGVDRPDFGVLFADMEFGDGAEIDTARLLQPRAEAEIALVLDRDLDRAPHGFAEIIRATAFVLPAIEIVDSRIANWDISIVDTVADNASCGVYVLGSRPTLLSSIEDLRAVQMEMHIDGELQSTGVGAACLGNPLHAARWLADLLCTLGRPLRAGDVVMTGALGPMRPVVSGQTLVASISGLGSVTTTLTR